MDNRVTSVTLIAACLFAVTPAGFAGELRRHDTPYYMIYTDLPPEGAAEAVVRMTRLAEVLRRRTRELGFTGRIDRRLPFYLYARHADYVAAGYPADSNGTFDGDRLVAAATDSRGSATWHVVQHEAFHQFAAATTAAAPPAWLDEGLGEYFGEALFTGDGYVSGVVPGWRLARVRRSVQEGKFQPLAGFARLSHEAWNRELALERYDQAWSIAQFLLHADGGRHRERLVEYVRSLGTGKSADATLAEIETRWRTYWLELPEHGTSELEAEATVATITSFLGRSAAQGQTFDSFEAFVRAARDGSVRCAKEQWLPPSMLVRALESLPEGIEVTLRDRALVARWPGGMTLAGRFTVRDGRVAEVKVERMRI